jgi:tetratricopeptide (TPR) repeat protein
VAAAPDDEQRQRLLIEFLAKVRGVDVAQEELGKMIESHPDSAELRFLQASLLNAKGEQQAAEEVYRGIIDSAQGQGPDAIKARNVLAQQLIKEKRGDEAAGLIEAVLAESPREPDALQLHAVLSLQKKDAAQAIADLRSVLRDYPDRAAALRLLGQAHAMQGENALAQDAFEKAIALAPKEQAAYLMLAELQSRNGDVDGAQATMERLLEKVPSSGVAQQALAQIQASKKDWTGLAERGRKIQASNPDHPLGYYLEGLALQQQAKHQEAIAKFQQALDRRAGAVDPLIAIARSQLALGAIGKAEERLNQVLEAHPDNLVALTLLGDISLARGKTDKAADILEQTVRTHPASARAYLRLSQLRIKQGDRPGARKILEQGVQATDHNSALVMELANLLGAMGERAAAVAALEDVIQRHPEALGPVNNLAMLLANDPAGQADLDRAMGLANRLKESKAPLYLDTIGWVHYLRGEYAEALPYLEKAVAGNAELAELRYHLGMDLLKLGRTDEARGHLEAAAAAKNFPMRENAQKALATLKNAG